MVLMSVSATKISCQVLGFYVVLKHTQAKKQLTNSISTGIMLRELRSSGFKHHADVEEGGGGENSEPIICRSFHHGARGSNHWCEVWLVTCLTLLNRDAGTSQQRNGQTNTQQSQWKRISVHWCSEREDTARCGSEHRGKNHAPGASAIGVQPERRTIVPLVGGHIAHTQ